MAKIITALICMILLCSCGTVSVNGTENLLVAPKLNERQEQVSKALESTLSPADIEYKYPKSGEYRSPFVFFDLSGDGLEEAIVFYSNLSEESEGVRAKILRQDGAGAWFPFYDITLQNGQLDFIEFQKLLDPDSYCMMVGMGDRDTGPSSLAVYSMHENAAPLEAEHQYYSYTVRDFNDDGLAEIAVIARDRIGNSYYLTLLQKQGSHLAPGARVNLSSDVGTIEKLTYGKLWDGGGALYIDEALADGPVLTTATEIVRTDASGLELLAGGDNSPSGGEDSAARSSYEVTFRDEAVYCMDFDGDGVVEVPYPVSLPASYNDSANQPPKLIQLMHLMADGFDIRESAVINYDMGYMLFFPDKWLDEAVTVENRIETLEWHFRKWNSVMQEPAEELLRIRAADMRGGGESLSNYTELGIKGMTSYMAYIPGSSGEPLSVTEDDVRGMFRLLP